jgi:galactokinase
MVKHALADGEYAKRREQCGRAVAFFQKGDPQIKALRDVTMAMVKDAKGSLGDMVFRRARHVVSENGRTTEAAKKLADRDYERVGELMVQSHTSLRDDYEVSVPELDFLVEESMRVKGVYGARMTGGGFGGSIIALAQPRAVEALMAHLNERYQAKFGKVPGIFATKATAGASVVE